MDSIISLGQKNTLAEYMIFFGADNRPPMLDKDLYDSWKIIMELYMQNREHETMILESVEHGRLIWPTVEENGVIRTKKYAELSASEKIQADCDMKATNIILQGLPADIYSLVNHHRGYSATSLREQGQNYSGTTYKSNATGSKGNTTSGQARVVKCYNCQGDGHMARQCTQPKRPRNAAWYKEKAMLAEAQEYGQMLDEEQLVFLTDPRILASQALTIIPHYAVFHTEDLDTYDSDCDDLSTTQAVLMANISNYGSEVISELNKIKLDLKLVSKEHRLDIKKCNGRIPHGLTPREPTIQVILDAIALTPCYPAFLITADVPEVYIDIFQICPRVQGRDIDALPSEEDTVSFLRELGHTGRSIHSMMLLSIRCINLGELLLLLSIGVYLERLMVMTSFISLELKYFENQRDLPRDIPLDSVVVLRKEKSLLHDQGNQQAAEGKKDDAELGKYIGEKSLLHDQGNQQAAEGKKDDAELGKYIGGRLYDSDPRLFQRII
nr:hypothetical protein [Tanacetum cinerariifolium]